MEDFDEVETSNLKSGRCETDDGGRRVERVTQ